MYSPGVRTSMTVSSCKRVRASSVARAVGVVMADVLTGAEVVVELDLTGAGLRAVLRCALTGEALPAPVPGLLRAFVFRRSRQRA